MSKLILCTHDRASLVSLAARNLGSCQEPCLVNFYGFLPRSTLSHFTIIGLISSKILIISIATWQTQLDGALNLLFRSFYWRLDVLLGIYSLLKCDIENNCEKQNVAENWVSFRIQQIFIKQVCLLFFIVLKKDKCK